MSLLNKKIDDVDFKDIEDLVNIEKPQENEFIDFKREINRDTIHKDISAFANTYGGWILVGIREDDNSRPKEIVGVEENDLGNFINSICMDRISPPVFCQTRYVENENKDLRVFIIRIDESDLTPHAIDYNTTVYIRVKDQKRPYKKADLDRIEWLKNRRQRHINLRESIRNRSRNRFRKMLDQKLLQFPHYEFFLSPKYPKKSLIEYHELIQFLSSFRFRFSPEGKEHGLIRLHIHSAADSAIFSQVRDGLYKNYSELNSLGQYTNLCIFFGSDNDKEEADNFHCRGFSQTSQGILVNLKLILDLLFRDIVVGIEILERLNFKGNVNISFSLYNLEGKRLFADIGNLSAYLGNIPMRSEIENKYDFEQEYNINELKANRLDIYGELIDRLIFEFDSATYFRKGTGEMIANHFQQSYSN